MLARAYLPYKKIKYNYNLYNSRTQLAYLVLFMYKQFEIMKNFVNGKLVNLHFFLLFVLWGVCI